MDTSQSVTVIPKDMETAASPKRQQWSIAEKRRIVEETLVRGVSVARVARAHGVNANQVFYWRKLFQAGRLGGSCTAQLLPVRIQREASPAALTLSEPRSSVPTFSGTIHIELRHAQVRVEGAADPSLLRVLLECLGR